MKLNMDICKAASLAASVFLLIYLSECQVSLYQVNNTGPLCPSDEVLFICQQNGQPTINWNIELPNGLRATFNLNGNFDSVGPVERQTVSSTSVTSWLISSNSTYILSSLRVVVTLEANLSKIVCNRETVYLLLPDYDKLLPSSIHMHLEEFYEDIYSYTIEWTSSLEYLYWSIMSSMQSSTELVLMNGTNTTLYLQENMTYYVNIFVCSSMNLTRPHIIIDSCLINKRYLHQEIIYTIHSNQTWTVSVSCGNKLILLTDTVCRGEISPELCIISTTNSIASIDLSSQSHSIIKNTNTLNTVKIITHTESYIETATSTNSSSSLEYIVILTSVASFTVFVILTPIIVISLAIRKKFGRLCPFYHKRKLNSMNEDDFAMENLDQTYSTLHFKKFSNANLHSASSQTAGTKYDVISMNNWRNTTISHNSSSAIYSTINIAKYADIEAPLNLSDRITNQKQESTLVQYSHVSPRIHPQDECINLDLLLTQLRSISCSFKQFGSVAGISEHKLNEIAVNCSTSSYDGLVEVCDLWLDKCRQEKLPPTWHAVAAILSIIGQKELADKIMDVYSTGKLPIVVDITPISSVNTNPMVINDIQDSRKLQVREGSEKEINKIVITPIISSSQEMLNRDTTSYHGIQAEKTKSNNLHSTTLGKSVDDGEKPPPVPPYRR